MTRQYMKLEKVRRDCREKLVSLVPEIKSLKCGFEADSKEQKGVLEIGPGDS